MILLSAENGCFLREPDQTTWQAILTEHDTTWQAKVMEIFEYYSERTPGSLIEKKDVSIVWHYRMADSQFGYV
jgi:trehalose-phosphatase